MKLPNHSDHKRTDIHCDIHFAFSGRF